MKLSAVQPVRWGGDQSILRPTQGSWILTSLPTSAIHYLGAGTTPNLAYGLGSNPRTTRPSGCYQRELVRLPAAATVSKTPRRRRPPPRCWPAQFTDRAQSWPRSPPSCDIPDHAAGTHCNDRCCGPSPRCNSRQWRCSHYAYERVGEPATKQWISSGCSRRTLFLGPHRLLLAKLLRLELACDATATPRRRVAPRRTEAPSWTSRSRSTPARNDAGRNERIIGAFVKRQPAPT